MPRKAKTEAVKLTEAEKRAQRFAALFKTPLGEEVLDDMRQLTIEKSTIPSQAADGMAMAMLMGIREGENNFFRTIRTLIRKGEAVCRARS